MPCYGGSVEVLAVDDSICEVDCKGPEPIGTGMQAAFTDKFPVVDLLLVLVYFRRDRQQCLQCVTLLCTTDL